MKVKHVVLLFVCFIAIGFMAFFIGFGGMKTNPLKASFSKVDENFDLAGQLFTDPDVFLNETSQKYGLSKKQAQSMINSDGEFNASGFIVTLNVKNKSINKKTIYNVEVTNSSVNGMYVCNDFNKLIPITSRGEATVTFPIIVDLDKISAGKVMPYVKELNVKITYGKTLKENEEAAFENITLPEKLDVLEVKE